MTPEQEIQAIADHWRAFVGRLPRAVESDLERLYECRGLTALRQAVDKVRTENLRRTRERVARLYQVLDVSPPWLEPPEGC